MLVRVQADSVWKPVRNLLSNILILTGILCMLVWAWGLLEPALYQHFQKQELERMVGERRTPVSDNRSSAAPDPAPLAPGSLLTGTVLTAPTARPGAGHYSIRPLVPGPWFLRDPLALGEIQIPRLVMSVIVREGMDDATLRRAAGHVPDTALPGQPGNFVVLGHRDTLFRPLRGLEEGDHVRVRTIDGDFSYRIDSIEIVPPEEVQLREAQQPAITLVTCFPFDFIGPAPHRFVARGHLEAR